MATFSGLNFIFNQAPNVWMDVGGLFVFYGLYFGVLGRDVSAICTDKMAAHIGVDFIIEFLVDRVQYVCFVPVLFAARNADTKLRE